jgi:alpha-tubulin suppressor-like RCC1 family protein
MLESLMSWARKPLMVATVMVVVAALVFVMGAAEFAAGAPTSGALSLVTANGTPKEAISAGGYLTCALLGGGTVECWGDNSLGQLGNGTNIDSNVPVPVSNLVDVTAISAGESHTCALLRGGTVECWGANVDGELGNGTQYNTSTVPVPVTNLVGVAAISAGQNHTCALLRGGTVDCWGYNLFGQLGNGTHNNTSTVPVPVTNLVGVAAISAGGADTCALLRRGTVECWGGNFDGELGNGTNTESYMPVPVTNLVGATAITVGRVDGYEHACALLRGGSVKCWGANPFGQLGNGTNIDSNLPVPVSNLVGVAAISAGTVHTCALLLGGTVDCWGFNLWGQLGNGTTSNSHVPVPVTNLANATAISAGEIHACALLRGGTIDCWGYNRDGELGNGSNTDSNVPVPVTGIP